GAGDRPGAGPPRTRDARASPRKGTGARGARPKRPRRCRRAPGGGGRDRAFPRAGRCLVRFRLPDEGARAWGLFARGAVSWQSAGGPPRGALFPRVMGWLVRSAQRRSPTADGVSEMDIAIRDVPAPRAEEVTELLATTPYRLVG